jgi:hypothetical protein
MHFKIVKNASLSSLEIKSLQDERIKEEKDVGWHLFNAFILPLDNLS